MNAYTFQYTPATWTASFSYTGVTDPGGANDPTSLSVNWGDGTVDSASSHTYDPPSGLATTYTVTVTLSDDDGGSDLRTQFVTVEPWNLALELNRLSLDEGGAVSATVTYDGPSYHSWQLDWGDDSPVGTDLTHTFVDNGTIVN